MCAVRVRVGPYMCVSILCVCAECVVCLTGAGYERAERPQRDRLPQREGEREGERERERERETETERQREMMQQMARTGFEPRQL